MRLALALGCALLAPLVLSPRGARAEDPPKPTEAPADAGLTWKAFAEARSGVCLGPEGKLAEPIEISAHGHKYKLEGHRLVEVDGDKDSVLRVGVISAIKDDREDTLAAIRTLVGRLEKRGIDVLIANGDLATDEFEMEQVFPALAETGVLVIATIGNTESCGSFNKIAASTFEKSKNFINGNWVRRIELDDATLVTLPGYYDRKFTHTGGASCYGQKDLDALRLLVKGAPAPAVVVSHGPPHQKGKLALDVATDGTNVGDTTMAEVLQDLGITFGIFGHILESGGRGTDLAGTKALPQKAWHPALFVNAGSANTDPWRMLDGSTSYGMALYVEIDKKKARYEVERLPKPAESGE